MKLISQASAFPMQAERESSCLQYGSGGSTAGRWSNQTHKRAAQEVSGSPEFRAAVGRIANHGGWLLSVALLYAGSACAQILDPTFSPSFNDTVRAIDRQADGTIIVGGSFNTVSSQGRFGLARLQGNGALLPDLAGVPDNVVRAVSVDTNGRIVIGGEFEQIGAFATRNVARLLATGALDTGFVSGLTSGPTGEIRLIGNMPNGKIAVAGALSTTSGLDRIALLNANGSVDAGFNPPDLDNIDAMVATSDNKILIAGGFDGQVANCTSDCVVRLNQDGSVDSAFNATNFVGSVSHISLDANGNILVTGSFSKIDNHNTFFVGRISQNGGADLSFTNIDMRNGLMTQIRGQGDGTVLIAGNWRWGIAGAFADRVARLTSSGARDTNFNEPVFGSEIQALSVSASFDFLSGGMFETANGTPRIRMARFYTELPDPVYANGFD